MDKKGLAITIMNGRKTPGGEGPAEEMESEDTDGGMYDAAAGNVMDAIQKGDESALAMALRDFVGMC